MNLRKFNWWLGTHYRLHLPALALMRIAVALVVIIDLLIRWPYIQAHYSNEGIWPLEFARQYGWKSGYWSFHLLNGSILWQNILFALHLIAALFLLLGWHTLRANFITWLLLVSLHNRNVYILQGGDDLLRITLFLGLFLPWNCYYSVDSKNQMAACRSNVFANLAYLLMIASVYLFTVLLKNSSEWQSEGSAVYYALSLEQLRLPFTGDFLYQYPSLLKLLTWFVLLTEALIPVLVLLPSKSGKTRLAAFFCICLLHLGIAGTLYVGLFPLIAITTALGLLPWRKKGISGYHPFSNTLLQKITSFVIITITIMCVIINLQGLPSFPYTLRREVFSVANLLRLDQYWGMFSPTVLKRDGWFVYQGVDSTNKQWDLRLNKAEVDYNKPPHIVSMYSSDRWRKLAENLQSDNYTFLRPLYARYVLKKWNRENPGHQMQMLNLYYMEKTNQPDYRPATVQKILYCVSDGR